MHKEINTVDIRDMELHFNAGVQSGARSPASERPPGWSSVAQENPRSEMFS